MFCLAFVWSADLGDDGPVWHAERSEVRGEARAKAWHRCTKGEIISLCKFKANILAAQGTPSHLLLDKVFKLCFPSTWKPMMGCVHRQVWRRVPLSTGMGHNRMLSESEVSLGNLAAVVTTVASQQEGWGFKSPRGQLGPFLCGVCLFSLGPWVSSHNEIGEPATLNWPQCECEWLFTVTWQPVQGGS